MSSAQRREVLDEMSRLSVGERSVNVVGGYAGWFHPHGGKAPEDLAFILHWVISSTSRPQVFGS